MSCESVEFVNARIEVTKALIVAYEDAILNLTTEGVYSYTLDTGQSRQTVTQLDLTWLQRGLDGLYNRLVTLCARLNGRGAIIARPDY